MATSEKLLYTCRSVAPFRPRSCYGVTLSGADPIAVRARRSSGGSVRHAVLDKDFPIPPPPGGYRNNGLTTGCLAVQESLTLWLDSPLMSRAKAEKVLPSLLDIQLPFPLEDCIYQFVEFRRPPGGTISALVCAARREAIQTCLGRYQAQGTDPMFLDHEGLALWTQSLLECPVEPRQYRVLIYLAGNHATLVIGCGERYGNTHSLQTSAQTVRQSPPVMAGQEQAVAESAQERNMSNSDLINRLQLLLHAGLPAGTNVQWLFCGARAADTALVEALHRTLTKEWPGPRTLLKEPASFLARALCERALKRGALRCNLRQEDFTHPAMRRALETRARAAAVSVLVAGLLLGAFSLTSYLLGQHRFNRVKTEIAALAGELAPGMTIPYGREIPEVQKAWEKQAPLTAPFLEAFKPSLAVRLAEVVKAGQASAVRFESLNLRRNSLALTGAAEDWDQCEQLEKNLKALGYSVKMDRQEAIAENEVRFTVNAEGGEE